MTVERQVYLGGALQLTSRPEVLRVLASGLDKNAFLHANKQPLYIVLISKDMFSHI